MEVGGEYYIIYEIKGDEQRGWRRSFMHSKNAKGWGERERERKREDQPKLLDNAV